MSMPPGQTEKIKSATSVLRSVSVYSFSLPSCPKPFETPSWIHHAEPYGGRGLPPGRVWHHPRRWRHRAAAVVRPGTKSQCSIGRPATCQVDVLIPRAQLERSRRATASCRTGHRHLCTAPCDQRTPHLLTVNHRGDRGRAADIDLHRIMGLCPV